MKAAVEIQNLHKKYSKLTVLDSISMQIHSGKITGIVGPNGCGKTTLIKSLLGLVVPDKGEILVQGLNTKNGWSYRKNLGYMPQNPEFPAQLKVTEILDLMEEVRDQKASRRAELVNLFDLSLHLDRPFGILSGGTKQKVAAVAAFMFDPAILILDEPTVGLDPVSAMKFKDLVRSSSQQGKAVLLVSHIMAEMQQLVDEMVFMLDGRVSFSGSTEEILKMAETKNDLEQAVVKLIGKSDGSCV